MDNILIQKACKNDIDNIEALYNESIEGGFYLTQDIRLIKLADSIYRVAGESIKDLL